MPPAPTNFSRIADADAPAAEDFLRLLETAFPHAEQRERRHWADAFRDPLCNARFYKNENAEALLVFWDFGHCRYVEYFAVSPNARGSGVGSALLKNFIAESGVPVILEIEPPEENEKNERRLKFYERLGFVRNGGEHFHPPYHEGFPRERLVVLNHGAQPLSADARERFTADLENRAMRYAPRAI